MTLPEAPKPYRLRRGVPVLPRAHGLLQVGMDPDRRVLVPRSAPAEHLLHRLAHGTAEPVDAGLRSLVADLVANGLVVDEHEQAHRARARAEARTRLVGPPSWCARLAGLLQEHGLGPVALADEPAGDLRADLTVLLTEGEPSRELVDTLAWAGDALLLIAVVDARVRLGPFVLPGSSACLRCVDAHLAVVDPTRPPPPRSALPTPVEVSDLVLHHVLLRAVAEVAAWAEGRFPRTWSATTWLDEDLLEEHREWARHPHCGCSWGDLLLPG